MKYQNPEIDSSYRENNLGKDLYDAVLKYKPKKIIEFGSLYGYSTVAMAMALDELGEGTIQVYDLFESYIYTHSAHKHTTEESVKRGGLKYYLDAIRMDLPMWLHPTRNMITRGQVMKNIEKYGLSKYVKLSKKNFKDWIKKPEDFDMMHFDVNNNGETIKMLYDSVKPFIEKGSVVYFEGGSLERDNLAWAVKHNLKKIGDSGVPYEVVNQKFPSISFITNNK
jgi:hypothetical protein